MNIINDMSSRDKLIALLDARKDRMLYTYKAHEKAADRYAQREQFRKRVSILLTVLTTGTLVTSIAGLILNEVWGNFAVAVLASIATAASFSGEFFDYKSCIQVHSTAGVKVRILYQKYESVISDLECGAITESEARTLRDALQKEEEEILADLPRTTKKDYEAASTAIGSNEKPQSLQSEIDARTPGRMMSVEVSKNGGDK